MRELKERGKERDKDVLVFSIKSPRIWFLSSLSKAKIEHYRWHDNRHTFCSRLAMRGENLKLIQQLAGHKTIQMSGQVCASWREEPKKRCGRTVVLERDFWEGKKGLQREQLLLQPFWFCAAVASRRRGATSQWCASRRWCYGRRRRFRCQEWAECRGC
jgi:hypothetical protein